MPWVFFEKSFDWNPEPLKGRVTVHFKRGMKYFVTRKCSEEAVKINAAKLILKDKEDAVS